MWEETNACRVLLGTSEVKRPLGRSTCIQVDIIKMELKRLLVSQYEGNHLTA